MCINVNCAKSWPAMPSRYSIHCSKDKEDQQICPAPRTHCWCPAEDVGTADFLQPNFQAGLEQGFHLGRGVLQVGKVQGKPDRCVCHETQRGRSETPAARHPQCSRLLPAERHPVRQRRVGSGPPPSRRVGDGTPASLLWYTSL